MADQKSSQPPEEPPTPYSPPDDGETLLGETVAPGKITSSGISAFSKGQVLAARFRILRFVARGGMGEVYEAEDLELNERVALKTVRFEMADNEKTLERFKREIQLARKVTHPNVCRTFDVFRHSEEDPNGAARETLIVSMELLRGTTLAQRIQLDTRLVAERALPIVEQMAAGLQAAHDAGVIHRDFKSANVILVPAEGTQCGVRAVITDFGLAHAAVGDMASLTGSLEVVGTPAYMAPEQLEGKEITPATDTYALGIVLYEMLTGKVPFAGGSVFTSAMRRLNEPAPSPRQLVQDLDQRWEMVILRCLERLPQQRFARACEVPLALRSGKVTPVPPIPKTRRQQLMLPVVALSMLAVFAAISYFSWQRRAHKKTGTENASATLLAAKARTSVAILGFQDLSAQPGSAVLGEVLVDSLWSQLDADQIRFIPPSRVDEMRRDLGIKAVSENPGKQDLQRMAQYLGSDEVLTGSYRASGEKSADRVEWNIHLLRTSDGESLASIEQPGTQSAINDMAARAGKLIRAKLGITLSPQEEARLDSSLSANPEALARFAQAREKLRTYDFQDAIKLLQGSIAADANFAKARVALAGAWADLGFEAKAQQEAKKAMELSASMSAEGKALVAGRYYETLHDWPKAMEQYSALWTLYGDTPEYALLLAGSQVSAGKPQSALTTLAQARRLTLPPPLQAQSDLAEADADEALSNFDQQMSAASAAAQIAQALNAQPLLARARIAQCGALLNAGRSEQAKPLCAEARKLNEDSGDALGTARATNEVANAYWRSGDLTQAKPLYEQALGIAQAIGDKRDEAGALLNLANIKYTVGDTPGAAREYQQSIAVSRERGSLNDLALAQQTLAMIFYSQGQHKKGEEAFQQAIQIARQIGDRQTEARALNNRCASLLEAAQLQQARESCEQSLQLRRGLDDPSAVSRSLQATGDVEFAEGDLEAAEQHYREALRTEQQLGHKADVATAQLSLANLALESGKFDEGLQDASDSVREFAAENDALSESAARIVRAQLFLASGKLAEARPEIEKARQLTLAAGGDSNSKSQVALVAAKIDARAGSPASAINALQGILVATRKSGNAQLTLETLLALGEAQLAVGRGVEGRKTLASAAQEARARGFGLLARKASAAANPAGSPNP